LVHLAWPIFTASENSGRASIHSFMVERALLMCRADGIVAAEPDGAFINAEIGSGLGGNLDKLSRFFCGRPPFGASLTNPFRLRISSRRTWWSAR
jgi:hypothetical protein